MVNPKDHYMAILKKMGVEATFVPYDALDDFFVPMTMEDRAAFDWELVQSIRDHNMDKLKMSPAELLKEVEIKPIEEVELNRVFKLLIDQDPKKPKAF